MPANISLAIAVFAVALAVRLLFLLTSSDRGWPHSVWYEGDAPVWIAWAQALESGNAEAFEFGLPLRAPGIAYALDWFWPGDLAPPFTGLKIAWCVMSALTCAIAYLGFRRVFEQRVSLIAAGLCALAFGSYQLATSLNSEMPYALLLFTIVLGTLHLADRPSWRLAIGLAALHGFAMLLRPEHPLLLALLTGYVAWRWHWMAHAPPRSTEAAAPRPALRFGTAMGLISLIVVGALLVILPWQIHGMRVIERYNTQTDDLPQYDLAQPAWTAEARECLDALPAFARHGNFLYITALARSAGKSQVTRDDVEAFFRDRFGTTPEPFSRWFLISMKGGLDFALANHPKSDGGFTKHAMLLPGEDDVKLFLARPDHTQLLNHGYAMGWENIRGDFGRWLELIGRKLQRFAGGMTLGFTARNLPIGLGGVRQPVDLTVAEPGSATIWPVAVFALITCGIIIAITRRVGGIWLIVIGAKLIVTILFYGYARQAASIMPAFLIFAAIAIDGGLRVIEWQWQRPIRWNLIGALILAAALVIDIHTAWRKPTLRVEAANSTAIRPAPHLGDGAFESSQTLRLR